MIGGSLPRACVAGLLAALLASPAAAAPGAQKSSPITVSADVMSIDAVTRVVTATGRVRITDGVTTATAGRATLYHAEGQAVLADHARLVGPQGVLEATEITIAYTTKAITRIGARGGATLEVEARRLSAPTLAITPATGTVTAEDGVKFLSPPDVVATGQRLTYQRSRGVGVLEGAARIQNRDGFVQGDRIDAHERGQRATVTGDVVGRFRDIEVKSRTAELFGLEKKAIFLGDVQVTQPGRSLITEKVTVWYTSGRIVAEGQTRVRLEAQP